MGERYNGIVEVGGSIPPGSTTYRTGKRYTAEEGKARPGNLTDNPVPIV